MSSKYQQNAKQQSREWFVPFGLGIIIGVVMTLVINQFRSEMAEENTVANAALEGARPLDEDVQERPQPELAAPERQPKAPAAPPPTAATPAPEPAQPAIAAPTGLEPSPASHAPAAPVAAPAAPPVRAVQAQPATPPSLKAPAPALYASAEKSPMPALQPTAAPRPQLPAASSIVHAPPPTAAVQPAPATPLKPPSVAVDPNSEEGKLAAAAQVRVKGDTPIDSMLDQALTADRKGPTPVPASAPVLSQTPTRDDVVNTMSVLVPAIRGCAQGQSGLAPMSIVVLNDGRVESAALSSGPFQGTASGRCMEGVVRRARFPHFKQANFRVQFPFAVQ